MEETLNERSLRMMTEEYGPDRVVELVALGMKVEEERKYALREMPPMGEMPVQIINHYIDTLGPRRVVELIRLGQWEYVTEEKWKRSGQAKEPVQPTCGTCRYYQEHLPTVPAGVCHRCPPHNASPDDMRFPQVSRSAWCGEHQFIER